MAMSDSVETANGEIDTSLRTVTLKKHKDGGLGLSIKVLFSFDCSLHKSARIHSKATLGIKISMKNLLSNIFCLLQGGSDPTGDVPILISKIFKDQSGKFTVLDYVSFTEAMFDSLMLN